MKSVSFGVVAFLAITGCSNRNKMDTMDAVKQGVIKDLSKNVNVGAMDVNVVSVSFRDKEADAVVAFAPKGGTAAQGLTMNYTLERQGTEWHIKKRSNMQSHGAEATGGGQMGGQPGGQMGGQMGTGSSNLPPGHPSPGSGMGGSMDSPPSSNLPPGHPPLNGNPKI